MFPSIFLRLLLFFVGSIYDFIPVSSITRFTNGVPNLHFSSSTFPSIITIIRGLFPIKRPIRIILIVFHIDWCVFILLEISSFLNLSVHEILRHRTRKVSSLAFPTLSIVHVSDQYTTTKSALLAYKLAELAPKIFLFLSNARFARATLDVIHV